MVSKLPGCEWLPWGLLLRIPEGRKQESGKAPWRRQYLSFPKKGGLREATCDCKLKWLVEQGLGWVKHDGRLWGLGGQWLCPSTGL